MIEIKHLSKKFGELEVLKDVSLTIKKGEVVTIIGSSGSGKSTLLRCINLLEQPTGGSIYFAGTDIVNEKVKLEDIRKNACVPKTDLTVPYDMPNQLPYLKCCGNHHSNHQLSFHLYQDDLRQKHLT